VSSSANGTRGRYAPLVIIVIAIGWLFSFGVGAIQQNWEPLTVSTPALLLAAGYTFGISITRVEKQPGDDDDRHT
jgi:hypothetical protein